MPELPEVETVRRFISERLFGDSEKNRETVIVTVSANTFKPSRVVRDPYSPTISTPVLVSASAGEGRVTTTLKQFSTRLIGQQLIEIQRKGKLLIFLLEKDTLLIHLGMSGRIFLEVSKKTGSKPGSQSVSKSGEVVAPVIINPISNNNIFSTKIADKELDKHLYWRMKLQLDNRLANKNSKLQKSKHVEAQLSFYDPRTFGGVFPVLGLDYRTHPRYHKMGLDGWLSKVSELKKLALEKKFKRSEAVIKNFLLDQSRIAGVGNIYADESLFRAKIHPQRIVRSLSEEEWGRLVVDIKACFKSAIKHQGTSFGQTKTNFQTPDGRYGENQGYLKVYGRKGEPCTNCGTSLSFTKISNRSTVFCRICQK